jgi:hypothetical protein
MAFRLCWQEWNLGDTARNVPALQLLNVKDFNFLDSIPLSEEEKRGWRGWNVSKRRQKLCNLITVKASTAGLATSDHTPTNVRRVFEVTASEFSCRPGTKGGRSKGLGQPLSLNCTRRQRKTKTQVV